MKPNPEGEWEHLSQLRKYTLEHYREEWQPGLRPSWMKYSGWKQTAAGGIWLI